MNRQTSIASTCLAGEYFVAGELAKLGHIALITLRNTDHVDILASRSDGKRSISIQVKTQRGSAHKWPLNFKAEKIESASLFYVFVTLKGPKERPEYYIVPSRVVAKSIRENHREWLVTPGRNGRKHNDNPMRTFDDYSPYHEKWEILGL